MKTVWISALKEDQPRVAAVTQVLKRYGLDCKGHFWVDVPEKLAWRVAVDALQEARADVWLVLIDAEAVKKPSVRYGLSLMASALREQRGAQFPVMTLWNSAPPASGALPQLMQRADVLQESTTAWAAKIVAKASMAGKAQPVSYRLNVLGDERLGQWFEIGPTDGVWDGVVFGVMGANTEITFQAVGPKGVLPEKSTLEFAQEGLQVKVGERDFTAWAVRNTLAAADSYFARVKGCPEAVLFMPYSEAGDSSADVVELS